MITLPPSQHDLQAYVDHQLEPAERQQLETYLSTHPELAAHVQAWQQDARRLRLALDGALQQPTNPALDPVAIRQRLRRQTRRYLASAALLLIAVSVGGLGGWQARDISLSTAALPMTDALQAYRLFAVQQILPADVQVKPGDELQGWLDQHFSQANRLPDLASAGFMPVSGRLMSTDQGAAAMILYQAGDGRRISFYIRPPGPNHTLLPRGSRRDDGLQAEYWSSSRYNYAMISPTNDPDLPLMLSLIEHSI